MTSFAHCFKLGVERSAMRNVGCAPRPFGTKGWAGSLVSGPMVPGTAFNSPPLPCCQAISFDEKSGVEAAGCAGISVASNVAMATPPARNGVRKVNLGIVVLLRSFPQRGRMHLYHIIA